MASWNAEVEAMFLADVSDVSIYDCNCLMLILSELGTVQNFLLGGGWSFLGKV